MKTRKGAASIYIVIFTTTLLGIIALSFVRIMLAESMRTTNYSLSQSAYNSALAGVEDAKIVLLRYQSCLNDNSFSTAGGKNSNCNEYMEKFKDMQTAMNTSKDCNTVGYLLHGNTSNVETVIRTNKDYDTGTIDQAYTCVKIAAYTEDFLATLSSKNPTKLIPLRTDSQSEHNSVNRIQIQWFDDQNYTDISNEGVIKDEYAGFWKKNNGSDLTGRITTNKGNYSKKTAADFGSSFTEKTIVPPVVQATLIQTNETFTMEQFYASAGTDVNSQTNRGTLMLRPSTNNALKSTYNITNDNHSNVLPMNSLAYSANKSFNTPMDVVCNPNSSEWGTYACSADIYLPQPIGGLNRNMATSFMVVNLPYGGPQTDISVKMFSCADPTAASTAIIDSKVNCRNVYFANVQPMIDSTGRANDLFRRVESRIELADTNFPIANYALAMTDPNNTTGIVKDFYTTYGCNYSSSEFSTQKKEIVNVNGKQQSELNSTVNVADGLSGVNQKVCPDVDKNSSLTPGKGNGE
ncbi:MAG: hypothetical protein MJ154_02430 [Candidatus Saccharibacteria bacterium]|nr:hypothetical protein [Candidatus Saccharibacteria bacterium]